MLMSCFLGNDVSKWKWSQVKLGGIHFDPRCGMPIAAAPNKLAYCFGGVFDVDQEEDLAGNFFNDVYCLDLEKLMWRTVNLTGKKTAKTRKRKNKDDESKEPVDAEMEPDEEETTTAAATTTIADDGIFKVTLGPTPMDVDEPLEGNSKSENKICQPSCRMNCGLAVKHNVLYLYGGMFEEGDKQITFSDMYSLDLKKLEEWKVIIEDDTGNQEWLGSSSDSEGLSDNDDDTSSKESD